MQKPNRFAQLYSLNQMPNTSSLTACFNLLLALLFHLHELSFFYFFLRTLHPQAGSLFSQYTVDLLLTQSVAPVCYSLVILITLLILLVVLYNQDKYQGFRYILAWLGSRIFPVLRILIELNVIVPAYFMMVDPYSGILFGVAVIINLFVTFFMQNYSIRKDYLCCRNVDYLMLYKSLVFLGYGLNALAINAPSQIMFMCTLFAHLIISLTLFIVYFVKGATIYEHAISRTILLGTVVFYLSLSLGQLCDEFCRFFHYYPGQIDILYYGIFCLLFSALAYTLFYHVRQGSLEDNKNLLYTAYFIGDKIGNFSSSIEDECQMRGLIKCHIDGGCTNPDCFSLREDVYDSKSNKICSLSRINQNKQILLKLLLKCYHQLNLEREDTLKSRIDYTEFCYYMLRNTYKSLHLVYKCDAQFQFPHERIRLARLKRAILMENRRLNKELYEGNLDLQFVIQCQKKFEQLKSQVDEVVKRNLQFWQHVHRNKIDLTELTEIVRPNFATMQIINDNWKELAGYFEIQKKWKFYYAWYILYVKNQKLKPVILQYFGTEVHEEELFSSEPKEIDKENEKSELKSSKIIFECNTAVLHTNDNASKPEIKQVNNYFSRLFGYTEVEAIGASINLLMPQSITQFHRELFEDWVVSGRSNSQPNYPIRRTFAKHKSGYLFGIYKYIKQLVGVSGELEYVAMMRASKEDETMLIMNENYCVEGMTRSLYSKLGFEKTSQDQTGFPLLNFLLICPKYLKHSQFKELLTSEDQTFFGIEHQKKRDRTGMNLTDRDKTRTKDDTTNFEMDLQNNNSKPKSDKARLLDTTEHHKLGLRVPENISELLGVYETDGPNKSSLQQCYRVLKKAFLFSRNCKSALRFNCEVDIVRRNFGDLIYYQVYMREMYSLDNRSEQSIIVEKRRKKPVSFSPEDFHKFFESSQDNRAYSLTFSNNIFIKQDNNRAVQRLSHIDGLTFFMRVFFFVFLTLVLVAFLFNSFVNYREFEKNSRRFMNLSMIDLQMPYFENKLYDVAFINNQVYNASVASSDFNASLLSTVNNIYNNIENLKNSSDIRRVFYDPIINIRSNYRYPSPSSVSYDEIDIVDKSIEIAEVVITNLTQYNLSTKQAVYMQQYFVPGFSQVTKRCSRNIQDSFQTSLDNIGRITIIMYIIEGLAIGMGLLLAVYNTRKITNSYVSIMEVFTQFSQPDIVKIYRYCHCLVKIFRHLNEKDSEQRAPEKALLTRRSADDDKQLASNLSFNGNYYEGDNTNNININKKIKKVEPGPLLGRLRLKTLAFFAVFLSIFAASSFYLNSFIRSNGDSINSLAQQGGRALSTVSLLTKVQLAVKKRFKNSTDYDNNFRSYFQSEIDQLSQMRNASAMVATVRNFQFQTEYNNVYFGRVCNIYAGSLAGDADMANCEAVAQNSLLHGVQSYIYYFTSISSDYLNGLSTITVGDILDMEAGLYYVNIFLQSLAQRWLDEFAQVVSDAKQSLLVYSVCILSGYLLFYLVLIEMLVIGNLNSHYGFFRRVYEMYMPDYLVSKEKIIKAKLIVDGILNK